MSKFFSGTPEKMGVVSALQVHTFQELVDQVICSPQVLSITRKQFIALDAKAQNAAKACNFITPCAFALPVSARNTASATVCNLVIIDVDESVESTRMLSIGFSTLLGDVNAIVWHTARSTPLAPRLRVIVEADSIPSSKYSESVTQLGSILGMNTISRESRVVVQPMYLPVQFSQSADTPIVYKYTDGSPMPYLGDSFETLQSPPALAVDDGVTDITYLRSPVEGISVADIQDCLSKLDPDCPYYRWVEIGMALKHQLSDEGFPVWDEWSSKGDKYSDTASLQTRWNTFDASPSDRQPVTIRSVLRQAVDAGWSNRGMTSRLFEQVRSWIASPSRSSEELLDSGAKCISKLDTVLSDIESKVLIKSLHKAIQKQGMEGPTLGDLSKEVKRLADASSVSTSSPPVWVAGMVFLTAPNIFFRLNDGRRMRPEVVDLIYRSPNPKISSREYLIHHAGIPVVENTNYSPASKLVYSDNGIPYVNTYRRSYPKPDAALAAEVGEAFEQHAYILMGPQDYLKGLDFITYMVQQAGEKINYSMLIQSTQGGGKGLLGKVCEVVLGWTNTQRVSPENIVGPHNGWAVNSQLVIIDEARQLSGQKYGVIDKLKPLIADEYISVRRIYEPAVTLRNLTNYLLFTNYHDALPVHRDDRRYLAIKSPLQTAEQVKALGANYYAVLFGLLATHAGGLRHYFETRQISPDFDPKGRAPLTSFFKDMVKFTASPLASAVIDALEDGDHPLVQPDLVSLSALRSMLHGDRLSSFSDQGLSSVLIELGFMSLGRVSLDGTRHTLLGKGLLGDPKDQATKRLALF